MNILETYHMSRKVMNQLENQCIATYTWKELAAMGEKLLAMKALHKEKGVSLRDARDMVNDYDLL